MTHPIHIPALSGAAPSQFIRRREGMLRIAGRGLLWGSFLNSLLALLFLFAGALPRAFADQSPPNCTGSGLGINLFTSSPDVHIGETITYSITVFNGLAGSGRIVCDATSIEAFVMTPDGVSHPITLIRTTLLNGQLDFYANVASYVVRAQDLRPDGTVRATANDTGIIHQNETNSQGGGEQGVNTEVSLPCIQIGVQCVDGIGADGMLWFTGSITNCGNQTMVGVTITNFVDSRALPVTVIPTLAIGQVATFSGSWVPLEPCRPGTATLVVQGMDEFTSQPRRVSSSATTTCSEVLNPAIQVTQACPVGPIRPGQSVMFTGTVRNSGDVTLTNVVIRNDQTGSTPVFLLPSLAPGVVASFSGSYPAPTNCSSSSVSTATAASVCGDPVSASAGSTCAVVTLPAIDVVLICPPVATVQGGVLMYTGVVRNIGDVTLTNVVVSNNRSSPNTVFTVASLAPGAFASFTGNYLVPSNCCTVSSMATATAADACTGQHVTDTGSSTCVVLTAPQISVTKICPDKAVGPGDVLRYRGTVSNTGDITLVDVVVVNDRSGSGSPVFGPVTLVPGESADYTASYVVPADFCGDDVVTARGRSLCGTPVTKQIRSSCAVIGTIPGIEVTKDCPLLPTPRGGIYSGTGTVRSSGNVTLVDVIVVDNQPSNNTPVLGPITLAPGASVTFPVSYITPKCCCSVVETMTARGRDRCSGIQVSATDTSVCPLLTAPAISLVQDCPPVPLRMASLYHFSGYVTNTGDVVLTNVFVFGPHGTNTPVLGPIELAPGEREFYAGSYLVPTNTCFVSVTTIGYDSCSGMVTANATGCPVLTVPDLSIVQSCPPGPIAPGDQMTITGIVGNSGDITLTNVVVLGNQDGATPVLTIASLLPGALVPFSWSYSAPTNCFSLAVSTVTATSSCGVAVTNSSTTSCTILTTPRIAVTLSCPPLASIPGGVVVFTGRVRNTGNVDLHDILVLDELSSSGVLLSLPILAPGAFADFRLEATAPAGECTVNALVSANGVDTCSTLPVSNSASAECTLLTTPQLVVTQACPINPVGPGALLTFTGTVRNAGNITLNNVVVTNDHTGNGALLTIASLAPGVTRNFTGSYLAPASGTAASTSTARGTSACGVAVANTGGSVCPIPTAPGLAVSVLCPPTPVVPGGLLVFTGSVTNTGDITLTNVLVVANHPAANTPVLGPITLLPGTGASFTTSYTVPLDVCSASNLITVTARDSNTGLAVSQSATADCTLLTSPQLVVTQTCPINPVGPGALLVFTGTVRNAGNITLNNVVVTNDHTGTGVLLTIASLAPGVTRNFTGSYLAPASGTAASTSTARGTSACGVAVADTGGSVCPILTAPGLAVNVLCPPTPVAPGGLLVFSGSVTNTGDITLTNVLVVANHPAANTPVLGPITLLPGTGASFTTSYTVPLDVCSASDLITVTARDSNTGLAVSQSATAECTLLTTPQLVVTQACPINPVGPGALLTFTGTVRNAGNITLNNVVVTNDHTGNGVLLTIASLAPGVTRNFTGGYLAPASGTAASTSTARGISVCGVAVADTGGSVCPILTAPGLAVNVLCPPTPVAPGGLLVFTGSVTNTGDITLTNVLVVANHPAANTPVLGPITLLPGTGASFTTSYTVPLDVCSASDLITVTARDSNTGLPLTKSASAECGLLTTPQLVVTQVCPPGPVTAGTSVSFSGSVRNSGNITLTNVLVFGTQPDNGLPLVGPLTLAPGATAPFSGTYIATTGSDPVTNLTIVTNITVTVTTNLAKVIVTNVTAVIVTNSAVPYSFGTIDPIAHTVLDRFVVGPGFSGLTYAGEDHGYAATLFYSMRQATGGGSFFDTINAKTGSAVDRFVASNRTFNGLTYAAGDLGYGPLLFYYLSHDSAGVSTFGSITPGGVVGVIADHFVVGSNFDALTFTATDVGYGANLFYYVRHDANGLSTFGTINPAQPGTITDRFTVGNNVHALVFTDLIAPGFGPNNFYYLRRDAAGVSTFGTIFVTTPSSGTVTDRFSVGTNVSELTFTATDAGSFGPNLFYYLRGREISQTTNLLTSFTTNTVITLTTNSVALYTTNRVVLFTPTNVVRATGVDQCEGRTVAAAANCLGPVSVSPGGSGVAAFISLQGLANGALHLSFPTEAGVTLTVQYTDSLSNPEWTDLQTILGTGEPLRIMDPEIESHPVRFYRTLSRP